MLTGRAAELRPDINYLHVRRERLDVPQTPKWALPGEFKELLAQSIRIHNRKAADERRARQLGRDIPTSGAARRRAKAHRNLGLCLERTAAGYCREAALTNRGRCQNHAIDAERLAVGS